MKPALVLKSSIFAFACLSPIAVLAAPPSASAPTDPSSVAQEPLSLKDAEAIALRAVPGGKVLSVERDVEWGRSVFEVEMLDAEGWEIDLLIDAGDGKVLRQRRDD